MKTDKEHIQEENEKKLFSGLSVNYSKSKDDVWNSIEEVIEESTKSEYHKPSKVIKLSWIKYAAAAFLVLAISIVSVMKLYTIEILTMADETKKVFLPDGSSVHLNTNSNISYAPYWWNFSREIQFNGEAFFEVEKGKRFAVISEIGSTHVLGTSFNIYSRNDVYEVFCSTGKVKVENTNSKSKIINSGEQLIVTPKGNLIINKDLESEQIISWTINKFVFNTTPLKKVIQDLERHYNTEINVDSDVILTEHYTGIFNRNITLEEALKTISFSFDLNINKINDNSYLLSI